MSTVNQSLAKIAELHQQIFTITEQALSKIKPVLVFTEEEIKQALLKQKAILNEQAPFPLPKDKFDQVAKELGESFNALALKLFPYQNLLSLPQFKEQKLKYLLADLLQNKTAFLQEFSEKNSDCNLETVYLYVRSMLVPFVAATAAPYREHIKQKGSGLLCPFCGSEPNYAVLDKESGTRYLCCPLCHSTWPISRATCYHCGNTDQQSLAIFHLDDQAARRADVCHKCQHYIKTSNERLLGESVIPQIEDIITMELDIVAAQEGFIK